MEEDDGAETLGSDRWEAEQEGRETKPQDPPSGSQCVPLIPKASHKINQVHIRSPGVACTNTLALVITMCTLVPMYSKQDSHNKTIKLPQVKCAISDRH